MWLEHNTTEEYLRSFINAPRQERMKVLSITSGLCWALRDVISKVDTLVDEELRGGSHGEDLQRHSHKLWKE
jgi:hypothetical protein